MALAGSWCLWDVCLNNTTLNRVIRQMFAACSAASLASFPDVPAVRCCVTFSVCLTQTDFFPFFPYWIWKKRMFVFVARDTQKEEMPSLVYCFLISRWRELRTGSSLKQKTESNSKNTPTSGWFSFLRRGNVVTALMSLRLIATDLCVSTSSLQRKCFLGLF